MIEMSLMWREGVLKIFGVNRLLGIYNFFLLAVVPYSFASTSHFILTFSIRFTVVLAATLLGLKRHRLELFSLFVPASCLLGLLLPIV